MRIRIAHETTYRYEPETRWVNQNARLTPRSFDSQYVLRWQVSVDLDGALRHFEDSLGNLAHSFSHPKPLKTFVVAAIGEVETNDAVGVVRGAVETLPSSMFLRASAHAQANGKLRDFTAATIGAAADPLDRLHRLMEAIHNDIACDREAPFAHGGAVEAFALKKANAGDLAHVFIAAARYLEIPARYVSGYALPAPGERAVGITAWAEALAPDLGWVAFDCAHNLCPDARYVRVAVGFDSASAATLRSSHSGAGVETVSTALQIQAA